MWGCRVDANFLHCAAVSWPLPQFVVLLVTMLVLTDAVVSYAFPPVSASLRWVVSHLNRWFPDEHRKAPDRSVLPKP